MIWSTLPDHEAWSDFLSDANKKGFELTDEMTAYLGSLLESMKQFYQAATSTTGMTKVMASIPKDTVTFIQDHKGVWGQSEWEQFLAELKKEGTAYTDETTNYLGGIFESVKRLYGISPLLTEAKKATKKRLRNQKKTLRNSGTSEIVQSHQAPRSRGLWLSLEWLQCRNRLLATYDREP